MNLQKLDILCDTCGAPIQPEDIEISLGLARCAACESVFTIAREAPVAVPSAQKADLPPPQGVTLTREGDGLEIRMRWFGPQFIILALFCLIWNGFLVYWYTNLLGDADLIMLMFPLIHVIAGVGLTYYTLAGFLNTTTLTARHGHLKVSHGPLPWPGHRELSSHLISQLWVERYEKRNKNHVSVLYKLNALLKDHTSVQLLTGLGSVEEGWFLEHHLEQQLGITDAAVPGEST